MSDIFRPSPGPENVTNEPKAARMADIRDGWRGLEGDERTHPIGRQARKLRERTHRVDGAASRQRERTHDCRGGQDRSDRGDRIGAMPRWDAAKRQNKAMRTQERVIARIGGIVSAHGANLRVPQSPPHPIPLPVGARATGSTSAAPRRLSGCADHPTGGMESGNLATVSRLIARNASIPTVPRTSEVD